jgi:pimeloyl-ACP methyl ester carboxylesterase
VLVQGGELAVWERPGSGPGVLFCHATGFHARCWDRIIGLLPGVRAIAIDLRGHGRSFKPAPPVPWKPFGIDVAAVSRQLELRDVIGVGHSMGGHSLVVASAHAPEAFSELVLLDPVILPSQGYLGPYQDPHYARKRRDRWSSPDEMFDRFHDRGPFARWDERTLRDYCEYGLLPAPEGDGFVLACPPEIEGSVYEQSRARESDPSAEIALVNVPVLVVRAPGTAMKRDGIMMSASPTDPTLASRLANGRDMSVEYSHFIPMEAPEFVANLIVQCFAFSKSNSRS